MKSGLWQTLISHPFATVIIGGLLILGSVFFLLNKPDITNYPSDGENIVLFGDSLAAGVGASQGKTLAEQLSLTLNEPVIDLGVSGDTTLDGVIRIEELPENPKLVIIILGGNDVLRRLPSEEAYQNIRTIINASQARGAITALASVKSSILSEGNLTDEYRKISKETGSIFLGNILNNIFGDQALMSDSVHPNDAGYEIIAHLIAEKVEPYLH